MDVMDQLTPTSTRNKKVIKRGTFIHEIYKVAIEIYVMSSGKDVADKIKQLCKKFDAGEEEVGLPCAYTATFPRSEDGVFYIIFSQECLDVNTITHETDHLRDYILLHQGLKAGGYFNETSATLNAYLNEKVFRFFTKNKIPIKLD